MKKKTSRRILFRGALFVEEFCFPAEHAEFEIAVFVAAATWAVQVDALFADGCVVGLAYVASQAFLVPGLLVVDVDDDLDLIFREIANGDVHAMFFPFSKETGYRNGRLVE